MTTKIASEQRPRKKGLKLDSAALVVLILDREDIQTLKQALGSKKRDVRVRSVLRRLAPPGLGRGAA